MLSIYEHLWYTFICLFYFVFLLVAQESFDDVVINLPHPLVHLSPLRKVVSRLSTGSGSQALCLVFCACYYYYFFYGMTFPIWDPLRLCGHHPGHLGGSRGFLSFHMKLNHCFLSHDSCRQVNRMYFSYCQISMGLYLIMIWSKQRAHHLDNHIVKSTC